MNFEQYAARQQAQAEQQGPETLEVQEAGLLDQVTMRLDAEKLFSLKETAAAEIEAGSPPGILLQTLTNSLFGESSPEAATVAGIIDKAEQPGGPEMAITALRQRRRLLKQQQKQLDEKLKAIAAEIEALEAEENRLTKAGLTAAALDAALIDGLDFCRGFDSEPRKTITQAEALYNQYHSRPAIMGLMLERLEQLNRGGIAAAALDFVEQQQLTGLKGKIREAISGKSHD